MQLIIFYLFFVYRYDIDIQILCPCFADKDLTTNCSHFFFNDPLGSSSFAIMIHDFKNRKAEISLANVIFTRTESRTECFQILVSKMLTQDLYFDQIVCVFALMLYYMYVDGYCVYHWDTVKWVNFMDFKFPDFKGQTSLQGFSCAFFVVIDSWNLCEGIFFVILSELWKFPTYQ